MKWELDALKMLAKNPTVPGVALRDAISEIEKLHNKLDQEHAELCVAQQVGTDYQSYAVVLEKALRGWLAWTHITEIGKYPMELREQSEEALKGAI